MANPEQLAILKKGVEAWNKWRKENPETLLDLTGADLSGAHLRGAHLRGVDLTGAALFEADLREADLSEANLTAVRLIGADLSRADIGGACLIEADLFGADLSGANLNDANFARANLTEADLSGVEFTGAIVGWTGLGDNDLSSVKGLESARHRGASIIGIDTIYRSKGNIPEAFLRGAGVPDDFITYMRSLVGKAIEFYSCFISYSTKDQEFAERLHADLQAKGVRCWFAPHDVQAGRKLHEQIDVAIRLHEKLLLILSPNSMNSEWVKTEISKARKREVQEKRQVLFPIRLCPFETLRDWECFDADTGKESAREIREYFIPDFSNWKDHDSYQKALDGLLRALKAEAASPKEKAASAG